jgi:putative redox protein
MKIELNRLNEGYHLEAINEQGKLVHIDASPDIGGTNQGMRPMQLLLAAMGGCSTIDIISILKKQKQPLRDIKITVTGDREKDAVPSLFVEVHTHFRLYGDLDQDKVQRAVSLSVEKYCSVAKTLSHKATITYSFEILP